MGDDTQYQKPTGNAEGGPINTVSNQSPVVKPDGPQRDRRNALLSDFHLIDRLSHFNRLKIPERVVHARGAGAYGEFEVTHDISDICNIDMLLGVGKKTPCTARFSTTSFERGSAESIRDPKGMAIKFFTEQGNWDWVCLNIPMFFIRNPIKFPDLMQAQRRDPKTNLANPNAWWDWVCNNHESLHMVLWLYSEFGTMFSYRTLSAYVGHAYKWVMPDGSWKYVHFFLASDRGPNFYQGNKTRDPTDPDYATRDLYEAIEKGDYPTWTASVQVVDPKDVHKLAFNILDLTKHWNLGNYPRDIDVIPSRPFGKLTLNRNPQDYFAEIEQLAFSPSHLVPGVEPSEDPVLQARMFAYPDTQRYRLGVSNQQLPANQSKSNVDASLRQHGAATSPGTHSKLAENIPNSRPAAFKKASEEPSAEFGSWLAKVSSEAWMRSDELDYKFPREFWKVLPTLRSPEFQNSIVENMSQSVTLARKDIREKVYETLGLIADDLSSRVRDAAEKLVKGEIVIPRGKQGFARL